ncbi:MAG: hypothetical protein QOJ51_2611 [Acidobacteriaceae bacterium]|nr:hypothetical protein [Acidobacteriaceae bacterium]
MSMPSEAKKALVNLVSRSRIRKRNELIWLTQAHQQVTGDLGGSGGGRVGGYAEDMDSAGVHFHDEKDVESAQRDGVEGEEVGGQQPPGLSPQEGSPPGVCSAWCRSETDSGQDPTDRARPHAVSQSGEFPLDAPITPGRILVCQAQHQATDLVADGRPDRFG